MLESSGIPNGKITIEKNWAVTSVAVLFSCRKIRNGGCYEANQRDSDCIGQSFSVRVWNLYGSQHLFMYREGEQEYEALREYVNEEEREEDESEEQDSTLASKATVDFQALRKINSDIIAWIRIPDTKIDYPIVQGKNNAYYLKHMFQKTEHAAGSIFLDVDNEADFSNRKSILYGHNMKDGSMFQGLHRFQEESYLQEHNQVYLYLPDNRELVYKVIKCGYVKADSDTFWLGEPVETPQLLLSTCGADSSKRLVVWCELPQEEEEMTEENIKDIEILDFD